MTITITKGLDLPINGRPEQRIDDQTPVIKHVAFVGMDYIDFKPTMLVQEGDSVKKGQPLCTNKRNADVQYTAPAGGIVKQINRGAKRVLQSIVIEVDQNEQSVEFQKHGSDQLDQLDRALVVSQLVESGLWAALRTRPYSKQPALDMVPHSIFVTAMDSHPLAADPSVILAQPDYAESFEQGVRVLTRLTEGKVYVCHEQGKDVPAVDHPQVDYEQFAGPHPSGLVGTHIHYLDPVSSQKMVWHLNYQDVVAVGKLFVHGEYWTDRVIALSGPLMKKPRLIKSRLGANTEELLVGEIETQHESRIISGPVLSGRKASDWAAYLGRYHLMLSAVEEGREREFMGWVNPGGHKFSVMNVLSSAFKRSKRFDFNTSTYGSPRAIVPIGNYERVMPLDILPTQLLKALVVKDTDTAQALGCLELDEEDLGLCSFVSHAKNDYGPILRENLKQIETEG